MSASSISLDRTATSPRLRSPPNIEERHVVVNLQENEHVVSSQPTNNKKRYQGGNHAVQLLILFAMVFFFFSWSSDLVGTLSGRATRFMMETKQSAKQYEATTQEAEEEEYEASLPQDEDEEESYSVEENKGLAPPPGHPWHRWSKPVIDTSLVLKLLARENENAQCLEVKDVKEASHRCQQQIHILPYLVRNGTILRSQIKRDMLLKYKNTLTGRMRAFESMLLMAVQIAQQQQDLDPRMKRIAQGDFPIFLHKADFDKCHKKRPMLSWSRLESEEECHDMWPIPSYYLWGEVARQSAGDWNAQFAKWNKQYPWKNKTRLAIWRGSPTGHTDTTWHDLPRVQLVRHSMDRPDLIDAGLIKPRPQDEKEMRAAMKFASKIVETDFMKYRAIIDIDGHSWSSRFSNLLCFNSVVLKVQPKNVDYFHQELEPWKHYVPIHANMSNIEEVTEYVLDENNSKEMKQIIINANRWCQEKMTWTQLATDFLWILISYVQLLDEGNPDWYTLYKANPVAYNLPNLQMEEFDDVIIRPIDNEVLVRYQRQT